MLDYGTGNLRSVSKAFEFTGAEVSIIRSPVELAVIDALIYPGPVSYTHLKLPTNREV